jgi:hypothetical protein
VLPSDVEGPRRHRRVEVAARRHRDMAFPALVRKQFHRERRHRGFPRREVSVAVRLDHERERRLLRAWKIGRHRLRELEQAHAAVRRYVAVVVVEAA